MEKTLGWIAALVALCIVVAFPAVSFTVGFQYLRGTLESEAEINGRIATTFMNADPDHWKFQSNRLDQSGSFSFTFDTAGTFEYHCEYHPNMHGTIVVQ